MSSLLDTGSDSKSLQRALNRQQERIKYDEQMAAREATVKNEMAINKKADWVENLEAASESQRMKEERRLMAEEAKLAGVALVEIRRAALRTQLEQDYAQYEQELQAQGKAFYFKRE
ncbi:hypothetical protein HOLleu_29488 [Holothuria leucospilota]|uniref:Uncharacterized protein n=1 Tax=Holothuria leucospilota TaxID=206669 RepID=A0A9Q1BNM7_HOLLE|nr:hypothetical protein HOLleu_29488 [Holothuria leucospilota]